MARPFLGTPAAENTSTKGYSVVNKCSDLAPLRLVDEWADVYSCLSSATKPKRAHAFRQPCGEFVGHLPGHEEPVRRRAGFAHVAELGNHRPVHRRLESASSRTMKGAFPPSSMETRNRLSAACAASCRPTTVEPVKDSLRRRGSPSSAPLISSGRVVDKTLITPGGAPACSSTCARASVERGSVSLVCKSRCTRPRARVRSCGWPWRWGSSMG